MAGFFGFFDYTKPGPGVPEDAPPKAPFIRFFEILQRKFWNFIKVNMMFLIFNIPALLLGMFGMLTFFPNLFTGAELQNNMESELMFKFIILTIMMCVPMITVGPAQAGFTYILRNYTREEHAFLWSDFKDTALKNMKQSAVVSIINFFATFLMILAIRLYRELINMGQINVLLGTALSAFMVMLFIIFAMMNLYIYPIMITFKLKLGEIYKNSVIFAVIKFFPNALILLLNVLIIGPLFIFYPIIGFLVYILLTFSLVGFLNNFYVYPKLEKYMIARIEDEEEDDQEDEEEDDEKDDTRDSSRGNDPEDGQDDGDRRDADSEDDIKRYF